MYILNKISESVEEILALRETRTFLNCLSVVQETWVHSLGWEDALEKGMDTYSSILAWRIAQTAWQAVQRVAKSSKD